ncbi:lytic transglycosylase domain-containing protein [Agrobacterium tumefaciens]|nr:lytic transglycosylase domain-containing protein [Agrobacterium tumefaciens]MDS7594901.1 lytic transglycosylase domain-containing protein [Agrobacterium tumefaciens]
MGAGIWLLVLAGGTAAAENRADEVAKEKTACISAHDVAPELCIRAASYNADLCHAIEVLAQRNDVPADYFARLIWRESLFRADAISPKGAEGIAQFMPGTAKLRGLDDSFNVVAALEASSRYLSELKTQFGNLGLAAAAYNAGEAGLRTFIDKGRLPMETRDYVFAITGYPVETWKDAPPDRAAPALDDNRSFIDACVRLAETRTMNDPVLMASADWAPWGVQLAAHYNPSVANRLFTRAIVRLPEPLNAERALLVRQRGGNFGSRPRYAARIGRETRAEANELCGQIKRGGIACTVFRNR